VTTESKKDLYEALLRARQHLPGVTKSGSGRYGDHTTVEEMVAACRDVLNDWGLVLYPLGAECVSVGKLEVVDQQTGEVRTQPQLVNRRRWLLAHAPTGQSLELTQDWPVVDHKGKKLDHATAAATSMGLSYLLRDLLLVPRGEDYASREPVKVERSVVDATSGGMGKTYGKDAPVPPPAKPATDEPAERLAEDASLVMSMGVTAEDDVPEQLAQVPPDLTAADLRERGWDYERPSAVALETVESGKPLAAPMAKDLRGVAKDLVGKQLAKELWVNVGGDPKKGATINGYQARQYAALVLTNHHQRNKRSA